jgi:hypothetical protein
VPTGALSNGTTYTLNAKVIDQAGNASTATSNFTATVDTVAPTAPTLALVTDNVGVVTGALNSGGTTDDTNLDIKITLPTNGSTAVAGDTVQLYNNTTALGTAYTLTSTDISNGYVTVPTGALSNGTTYTLNAKVIDQAGNASTATSNFTVTVDTVAPIFSSNTVETVTDWGQGLGFSTVVHTAKASDIGSSSVVYGLSGTDANLFQINSGTGAVTFKTTETYAASKDAGADHVYNFNTTATDAAGNTSTNAVALTMDTPPSSLNVYYDNKKTQSAGKLLAPVTVDGGNTFYFWDLSGDGICNTLDSSSIASINAIFNQDVQGVANPNGLDAKITEVYRYGTLYTDAGASLKVALPTIGGTVLGFTQATTIGNASSSLGSNESNSAYNDYSAIWDAYNGKSTNQTLVSGVPPSWMSGYYWSATPEGTKETSNQYLYSLRNGGSVLAPVSDQYYLALQVVL